MAFVHRFPVRFDDVDHAGIVYYPRFYHYFHVAFEEFFLTRLGAGAYLDLISRRRIGFPAVHTECDYKAPLRFGDVAALEVTIARLGDRSVRFAFRVLREEGPSGPAALSAAGVVVCAVTDLAHFRAIEVPGDLRQLFLELVVNPE
jgi:4-hydroxybenzoyl-CoA thioesterase